jgi:hypothetical protein
MPTDHAARVGLIDLGRALGGIEYALAAKKSQSFVLQKKQAQMPQACYSIPIAAICLPTQPQSSDPRFDHHVAPTARSDLTTRQTAVDHSIGEPTPFTHCIVDLR